VYAPSAKVHLGDRGVHKKTILFSLHCQCSLTQCCLTARAHSPTGVDDVTLSTWVGTPLEPPPRLESTPRILVLSVARWWRAAAPRLW
jgi:hypothetical protein